MAKDNLYPKGIMCFGANDNAPDFVMGSVMITLEDLFEWAKSNSDLLTEYKGKKQIKMQLLKGDKGPYMKVDTFKPTQTKNNGASAPKVENDTLPF